MATAMLLSVVIHVRVAAAAPPSQGPTPDVRGQLEQSPAQGAAEAVDTRDAPPPPAAETEGPVRALSPGGGVAASAMPPSEAAQLAFDGGDYDEAARLFRDAIDADPNRAHLHAMLGKTLLFARDAAHAIAPLQRATELAPKVAAYHVMLGHAQKAAGFRSQAMRSYRIALQLDPSNAYAAEGLRELQDVPAMPKGDDGQSPLRGVALAFGIGLLVVALAVVVGAVAFASSGGLDLSDGRRPAREPQVAPVFDPARSKPAL